MDAYANTSGKQVGEPNSVQNPTGYTPTAMRTHLVEPLQETGLQVQIEAEWKTDVSQPSFAHEIPEDAAKLGWYGKMIHGLGSCFGGCGSVPGRVCCPNPYHRGKTGQRTSL